MPLIDRTFSDIITFTRTGTTATYFNSAGVLTTTVADEPRFDYNPTTLAARGFLIEEQRTNSIRNNTMQGAVAGTPGTLPTTGGNAWFVSASSGLATNVIGTGVSAGITYIDIQLVGTATGASYVLEFEPATGVAGSAGQTWTNSFWLSQVGGTTNNITGTLVRIQYRDSASVMLATGSLATSTLSGTLIRSQFTSTAPASTAFVRPGIQVTTSAGAVDITLRIGLPQLENNNISTGVASATVAAGGTGYAVGDVLQIVGGTGTAARVTVATLSGSAIATVTVSTAGSYSVFPSPQPVSVTAITGTGSSATFNIVPQTQTGFATSVIPTTTTALTRNADVASVNTLSPWYNATESTIYLEFTPVGMKSIAGQGILRIDDNTESNRISFAATSTNAMINTTFVSNSTSGNNTTPATIYAANTTYKIAFAVRLDDVQSFSGGSAGTIDTTALIPSGLSVLRFAANTTDVTGNAWFRRLTYYKRRLSNAQLQAITQ